MKKWLVICFILLSTAIVGCSKSSSDGTPSEDTDKNINGNTKECPNGEVISVDDECPSVDTEVRECPDGSLVSITENCPGVEIKTKYCPNGNVVPVEDKCPVITKVCPDGAVILVQNSCPVTTKICPNGLIVATSEPCPSSFKTCPDGTVLSISLPCPVQTKTCPNGAIVPIEDTCPVETKECPNGAVVLSSEQCPVETKECPDGSIVPKNNQCPDVTKECPNGSIIPVENECPLTDKLGYTKQDLENMYGSLHIRLRLNWVTDATGRYRVSPASSYGYLSSGCYDEVPFINSAGYWSFPICGYFSPFLVEYAPYGSLSTNYEVRYSFRYEYSNLANSNSEVNAYLKGTVRTDDKILVFFRDDSSNEKSHFWGDMNSGGLYYEVNGTNLVSSPDQKFQIICDRPNGNCFNIIY